MKLNLGVLFGGNSTEHEISIISALQAIKNIDTEKYNVIAMYLSKDNTLYTDDSLKNIESFKNLNNIKRVASEVIFTKKDNEFVLIKNAFPYKVIKKIDLVFPILHGYNTEDGAVAGYLETIGVPYLESDIYASVVGQDKIYQKMILKESGVNVLDYRYVYEADYEKDSEKVLAKCMEIPFPIIVKPARQGSSVGIMIAHDKNQLKEALEDAFNYDEKVLVEKALEDFKELNISVVGDNSNYELSEIEEVYGSDEILSYQDKYMSGSKGSKGMASAGRKIPADITKDEKMALEKMALDACLALNTNGVVRIDFMLNKKDNTLYLNELNIIPGSLAFYLWTAKDIEYKELLNKVIECGIKRCRMKEKKLSSFETNVLEGFNGSKGVKK